MHVKIITTCTVHVTGVTVMSHACYMYSATEQESK